MFTNQEAISMIAFLMYSKRLDLLALDEEGTLTIIELEGDAAGTLADLQAIRYAAFCSTMTIPRIIELRAEYTKKDKDSAEREIQESLAMRNC
jgi:hypothetical protein